MSKNRAGYRFLPLFIAETGFSTGPCKSAIDNARLSPQGRHFCTFYVDKIVSKAAQHDQSHWFISFLLPCAKMKQAVFYPQHGRRAARPGPPPSFAVIWRLGASPEFCTSSVDKSVRNTMLNYLSLWFISIYLLCVNFEHGEISKKKMAIAHKSSTHLLWITLCVTAGGWGKVLDP